MPEVLFKYIIGALFGIMFLAHGFWGARKRRDGSQPLTRRKRIAQTLALGVFLTWTIFVALYLFSAQLDGFAIALPLWLRWVGAAILLSGVICFASAQLTLGKNWSLHPEIRADHVLVMNGIYTWIRHPMYTAYILLGVGSLLTSANLLIGLTLLAPVLIICLTRIAAEEAMMVEKFGDAYREYKQRTGALWPKIRFSKN